MKNLDWHQGYAVAVTGIAIRRAGWAKWLVLRGPLWFIGTNAPGDLHVVLNTEFGPAEFFAKDWTDEPWDDASGGAASQPPAGARPRTPPGTPPPASPGGWSAPGNPSGPTAVNPPFSIATGPEPSPFTPPRSDPPNDPPGTTVTVPTVTVTFATRPDSILPAYIDLTHTFGQLCYPSIPDGQTAALSVSVSVSGGPDGVGFLEVAIGSAKQLGTAYRGSVQGFSFPGIPIAPGGGIACLATYRIGGQSYTGQAEFSFLPYCD